MFVESVRPQMFLGVLTHQALGLGLICGNRERLIMTFKQLAFILLVVSIIALCACGGVFAGRLWQYTIDDARIRGEVAERLEVSDDWAEIEITLIVKSLPWEAHAARLRKDC